MGSYIILWILFALYIIITLCILFRSKNKKVQTQPEEIDKEKIYNSLVKLRDLFDITLIGLGNFVLFIIAVIFLFCILT